MIKEFAPHELAVKLKKLGFDERCFGWYDGRYIASINQNYCKNSEEWLNTIHCAAPLYQQAFRFFREKYGLYSTIMFRVSMEDNNEYWDWLIKGEEVVYKHFKTYEEAELACLVKLIEIVEQQKQK